MRWPICLSVAHAERRIREVRRVCIVEEEIPFLTAAGQRPGHPMGGEEEEAGGPQVPVLPPHHAAQQALHLTLGRLGIQPARVICWRPEAQGLGGPWPLAASIIGGVAAAWAIRCDSRKRFTPTTTAQLCR